MQPKELTNYKFKNVILSKTNLYKCLRVFELDILL